MLASYLVFCTLLTTPCETPIRQSVYHTGPHLIEPSQFGCLGQLIKTQTLKATCLDLVYNSSVV